MNRRRDLLITKHTPSHVERSLSQDSPYALLAKKTAQFVAFVIGQDAFLRICRSIDEFPTQRGGETRIQTVPEVQKFNPTNQNQWQTIGVKKKPCLAKTKTFVIRSGLYTQAETPSLRVARTLVFVETVMNDLVFRLELMDIVFHSSGVLIMKQHTGVEFGDVLHFVRGETDTRQLLHTEAKP